MPAECIRRVDGDLRIALDVPGFDNLPSDSREVLFFPRVSDAAVRQVHRHSSRFHHLIDVLPRGSQAIVFGVAGEKADDRTGHHHGVLPH